MSSAVRVTLVEDHTLLAQSLVVALAAEGLDVAMVTPGPGKAADLLPDIEATRPDVVLLDLDLGAAGASTPLVEPLSRSGCGVVVVTGVRQVVQWGHCLALGAQTVLPKSAPLDAIVSAVHAVATGGTVMPPEQRAELVAHWRAASQRSRRADSRFARLTRREQDVLAALVAGRRVRDIATEACVAESTVRSQVKAVLAKLGVSSQIAAVALARDTGWQPTSPRTNRAG